MKFSLVTATLGRTEELTRLLQSLENQTYKNFELIVVDQNSDDRLIPIIQPFLGSFEIIRIHSEKGLSKSRNVGLKRTTGDVIAFPDDDCEYNENVLQKVAENLSLDTHHGITGLSVSDFGQGTIKEKRLNLFNVWFWSISYTVFLKKEVIDKVGVFDERLGVGSGTKYGSGEETDYLIRAIKEGFNLHHDSSIEVKHPDFDFSHPGIRKKAYDYSVGRMFVINKHNYSFSFKILNKFYPLFKLILNLNNVNKRNYLWHQFLGRIKNV